MTQANPYVEYTVGGTPESTFAVPFQFWEKDDLEVRVGGVITTAYTISGETAEAGGEITLATPAQNTTVSIQRFTELDRYTIFPVAGPFRIEALNTEFDRVIAMIVDLDYVFRNIEAEIDDKYINRDGDTMTGPLVLVGDPTQDLEAATKIYVDNENAAQDAVIAGLDAKFEAKNTEQDGRLDDLDAEQDVQDTRLDAIDSQQVVQDNKISVNAADIAQNAANILLRARWRNVWQQANTYEANDMVRDGVWTMVANKQTSERPVTEGTDALWVGDGATIIPRGTENEATYWTGMKYTWEDGGYFEGYRIDPPVRSGLFEYSVIARVTLPDGTVGSADQILSWQTFGGNPGEWITVLSPSRLWLPGTTVEVFLGVRAVTQSNTFTANWDVKNDNGNPSAGEAWFQNNQTEIRVNDEDKLGADQGNNLTAVQAGGTLQFAGSEWTITSVTDNGAFVTYGLAPTQGRPSEDERSLTFTWGSTDPLPVNSDATFWAGSANTRGIEGVNIDNPTESDSQFPVDVLLRAVTVSDDWDLLAYSSTGGGGGGSAPGEPGDGASVTTGPTFPATPSPGDLHYLTVQTVGLYVYYDDGNSLQWVQTNPNSVQPEDFVAIDGDTMTGDLRVGSGPHHVKMQQGAGAKRFVVVDESDPANPDSMSMDTDGGLGRLYWQSDGGSINSMTFASDGLVTVPTNIGGAGNLALFANTRQFLSSDGFNVTLPPQNDADFSGALFFSTSWGSSNPQYIQGRHFPGVSADLYFNVGTQGFTMSNSGDMSIPGKIRGTFGSGGAVIECFEGAANISFGWRASSQVIASINQGGGEVLLGTLSDYRIKEEVDAYLDGLDLINLLRPAWYTFKDSDDDTVRLGLIAHEVQAVAPWLVLGEKDGDMMQSVDYAGLVVPLIDAVKRLTARVEELEAKLDGS